jgi:hypothetical protein
MKKLDVRKDLQELAGPGPDSQLQEDVEPNAQLPPDPAPDGQPPQGPTPDANLPDVPQGPAGPNKQETVQARHRSTQIKAIECGNKSKRKKTSTIDCEQLFADVHQQFVHNTIKPPPLLHTPHSMFEMLCHTFEQEFPDRLQQQVVDQILLSLREDA